MQRGLPGESCSLVFVSWPKNPINMINYPLLGRDARVWDLFVNVESCIPARGVGEISQIRLRLDLGETFAACP